MMEEQHTEIVGNSVAAWISKGFTTDQAIKLVELEMMNKCSAANEALAESIDTHIRGLAVELYWFGSKTPKTNRPD